MTGTTGWGKTYLVLRTDHTSLWLASQYPFLQAWWVVGHAEIGLANGSYRQKLSTMVKCKRQLLDDWCIRPLMARQANDQLDVMEMRYPQSSTLIASQIPASEWHQLIPSPTIPKCSVRPFTVQQLPNWIKKRVDKKTRAIRSLNLKIPSRKRTISRWSDNAGIADRIQPKFAPDF